MSGGRMLGDPMEIALVEMAMAALGHAPRAPRLDTMPFDSDRRRMAVLHADGAGYVVYAKGALDAIFGVASSVREGNAVLPLDDAARLRWLALEARLGGRGFRVLAVAYRRLVERPARSELERELVLLGLVALADPPRPEVPEAIRRCTEAGIRVVMLTGDHPRTALAIAQQIGLASASCRVILGSELEHMKDARLQLALDEEVLFARVRADQKHRVVMAFQKKRAIVAVTGDGVNDAPALRAADVGIAMGKSGTDVARESSDVVLLDDNFASIVAGVEEGRAVYANLRKFLTYVLASNVPELVPYLAFALLGVPLPLTIVQVLAVDLGTDLVPALGLGAESPEPDTMRASPLPRSERLLSRRLLVRAYAVLGLSEALASLGGYATVLWLGGYRLGSILPRDSVLYRQATTACFGGIVAMQVANVFCCRSESRSPFARGGARNPMLLFGVGLEIVLLTGIVVTPLGQRVFGTAPPPPLVWLLFVPFAALHLALDALSKRWFFGRRVSSRSS